MRLGTSAVFSSLLSMFLISPHTALSKPNKSPDALRDRCEKRVADIFGRAHPQREYSDKDGLHIAFFHARYDPASSKCFYLEGLKTIRASDKEFRLVETLHDVDGNSEAGAFSGVRKQNEETMNIDQCRVGQKQCSSEGEWNQLISPMIGDNR
ncbi:MAG: hypothetical protein FJX48_09620 [Alphaproteobacteria bacterium]|nr:hypothetical protein [Alphaproteobacteria bacterium]